VKLTRSPTIDLGDSLSAFMHELGLGAQTGGHNGSITRLRRQTIALLRSKIAFGYDPAGGERGQNQIIANEFELWWDAKSVDQMSLYPNWVTLSEPVLRFGVPLDMRALKALKRSPLALDLYAWSAYRDHNRKGQVAIPWDSLARQFGAEYADPREFARYAKAAFRKIQAINPDLIIAFERGRLILGKSEYYSVPKFPLK
jgi:Plasmid encoded RepA protein